MNLLADRRGSALILGVAMMPLLIGAAAVAIDATQWAVHKRKLQRMADSAALGGAHAVQQRFRAAPAVDWDLRNNPLTPLSAPPVVENAPREGNYAGNPAAVRVILESTPTLSFVSFFMSGPTTVRAEATAMATPDPRHCMVALDEGPQPGIEFAGDADVRLDCGIMTNSKDRRSAIAFGGSSARVKATVASAVGGVSPSINWVPPTSLTPRQAPLKDPFATVPEAQTFIPSNCSSRPLNTSRGNTTLSPGCWRGGAYIDGTVRLNPGVYVIDGGSFHIGSGASISGEGVTFILTTSSTDASTIGTIYMNGNAEIKLSAPTSGVLNDLIFYQDRRARRTLYGDATGNSTSKFVGTLYFPSSNLSFIGNATMDSNCLRIVASKLSFSGSSSATTSCTSQADRLFGTTVRLVA